MDPNSELEAREAFAAKSLDVIGWYHSHPTFDPQPSIRDIENQAMYQVLIMLTELLSGNGSKCSLAAVINDFFLSNLNRNYVGMRAALNRSSVLS